MSTTIILYWNRYSNVKYVLILTFANRNWRETRLWVDRGWPIVYQRFFAVLIWVPYQSPVDPGLVGPWDDPEAAILNGGVL